MENNILIVQMHIFYSFLGIRGKGFYAGNCISQFDYWSSLNVSQHAACLSISLIISLLNSPGIYLDLFSQNNDGYNYNDMKNLWKFKVNNKTLTYIMQMVKFYSLTCI